MRVIAHRGFACIAPENTVGAATGAVEAGADAIECDVLPTSDGTPVVFHDTHLGTGGGSRGLTDRTGAVAETGTDTVTDAVVSGSGERVPTLESFVAAVAPDVGLNVELKHHGEGAIETGSLTEAERTRRRRLWQPFVEAVMEVLERVENDLLVSSFSEAALAAVRERAPDTRLAPIAMEYEEARRMVRTLEATTIHPSLTGLLEADTEPGTSPLTVNVWTVSTWTEAREARGAGADGIIADYPGLTDWAVPSR
jgi:glycerophosphoryl diester phosphodiesterase